MPIYLIVDNCVASDWRDSLEQLISDFAVSCELRTRLSEMALVNLIPSYLLAPDLVMIPGNMHTSAQKGT
jgi:hypothetical protein